MESVTYYEILNVIPSCSKNDIDFAYNKLMEISNQLYKDFREWDFREWDDRARIIMRIQKAHHTLSNADLRKKYDELLTTTLSNLIGVNRMTRAKSKHIQNDMRVPNPYSEMNAYASIPHSEINDMHEQKPNCDINDTYASIPHDVPFNEMDARSTDDKSFPGAKKEPSQTNNLPK